MVAITLTQLRALSVNFLFDYDEAREFLNLNKPTKTTGGSSKAVTKAYDGTTIPPTFNLADLIKPQKQTGSGAKKGRCGYHYYCKDKDVSDKVKQNLQTIAKSTGEKVPRNGHKSEVSRMWGAQSESKRTAWNEYAKSQNAMLGN